MSSQHQRPPSWLRGFLAKTEQLGFHFDGFTGSGHVKLRNHDKGLSYITPASPSDMRYQRNALNDMERMSGRKLPRANAAKYKTVKVEVTRMAKSDSEVQASAKAEELLARADQLRGMWNNIICRRPDRTQAHMARIVLDEYEEVRAALAAKHRIIPPLGV